MIAKLSYFLTKKDKRKLFVLLVMSLILSIVESVGVAAIMPFITVASSPDLVYSNEYYKIAFDFFNLTSSQDFIAYFGLILIVFYFFRGAYTILHGYLIARFSMDKYSDFSKKLYENYLHMPYSEFINKNSSSMTKMIITEAYQLSQLVQNALVFFTEVIIVIIMYVLLLMVDFNMTLILTAILGLKVLLLILTVSKKIKKKGVERSLAQGELYKITSETFSNFKIIRLLSKQSKLLRTFKKSGKKFSNAHIINTTLQLIPRSVLEAVGLSTLMGIVVYVVLFKNDVENVIPIISMYALALYRILPAITRIVNSYNGIVFYSSSLSDVYEDVSSSYSQEGEKKLPFNEYIDINNISFSFDLKNNIVKDFSLRIEKGDKLALLGESGSGKSTLIDLICGLYIPENGSILIDGVKLSSENIVSWREKIGYVPQSIYLFDGAIKDNIIFNRDYDPEKLIRVMKQANVYEFIMERNGLDTKVGESGIQLSGGQKQRVGIARALYGEPEIIILDEATSALDALTEINIMNEIYDICKDKTLIIIAHRLSTTKGCNKKVNLSEITSV
jgi:ATP-binding cassette, subfamily B, bacterial PglK